MHVYSVGRETEPGPEPDSAKPKPGSSHCIHRPSTEDTISPDAGFLGCPSVLLDPGSLRDQPSPGQGFSGPGQVDLPGKAPAWLSAYPLSSHFLSQPPSLVHNGRPTSTSPDSHPNLFFLFKNLGKKTIVYSQGTR